LHSGGAHQVNSGSRDDLDCRNFGNIAHLIGYVLKFSHGASPFEWFLLG
jgi:hypothetical protein